MKELVKIEKAELDRLRNIEKAVRAFKARVEFDGAAGAISRLLEKTPRTKEGRS